MTMRLAITGVDGFVGRHVATIAAERGHHVVGIAHCAGADVPGVDEMIVADLTAGWPQIRSVDAVVHLAGLAAVGPSFDEPRRYLAENAEMMLNLGEALLRSANPVTRVVAASTGAIYARSDCPITETAPLSFASPYAVSKGTVDNLLSYYRARGLDAVAVRPFNHIGPGQCPGFIVPDLRNQLDALGTGEPLSAGNLDAERDYTDVRDVAKAYVLLAEAPRLAHGVYNVASGHARSGHEVLAELCRAMNRSVPALTRGSRRPLDLPRVVGDATRLRDELGWAPQIEFAASIAAAVGVRA
ncbi:NAD-dependent epimerase/dehydratase family protein [Agrococcus citreus]|uniref:GDP-mannose 4,6-dehydratase n=1 Tax=Agrococcus citreus TaxID=84643 RepID=A0ABN1YRR9_9MICO